MFKGEKGLEWVDRASADESGCKNKKAWIQIKKNHIQYLNKNYLASKTEALIQYLEWVRGRTGTSRRHSWTQN